MEDAQPMKKQETSNEKLSSTTQADTSSDYHIRETLEDLKTINVALLEELNDVDVYEDIEEHPAFQKFLKD